jgi:hypothetical protein
MTHKVAILLVRGATGAAIPLGAVVDARPALARGGAVRPTVGPDGAG